MRTTKKPKLDQRLRTVVGRLTPARKAVLLLEARARVESQRRAAARHGDH